jgi:geranylgeranyl pyrophosphate synthase
LSEVGDPTWALITLAACTATGGDVAVGARVAAGVELFMAALDVLDEIEDGDQSATVEAGGMPQALNVTTALSLLAQQALLDLPAREGLPSSADFIRELIAGGLTATIGQHRDLASAGGMVSSPDDALAIAREKAGALMGTACRLGAMVGTADASLLDLYGGLGTHLGVAAQLTNDLRDATNPAQKSDIDRQKGTLPLVFSRRAASDGGANEVRTSAALTFTWVVLEVERQACGDVIEQLAAQGQDISMLRALL